MVGYRRVGLLDVAEGLIVQGIGERFLASGELFGVGILGFEIITDVRIGSISEPGIVIDKDGAVDRLFGMRLLGNGGSGSGRNLGVRQGRYKGQDCGEYPGSTHGGIVSQQRAENAQFFDLTCPRTRSVNRFEAPVPWICRCYLAP